MKRCCTLLYFLLVVVALCSSLPAQQSASESLQPNSGQVKGNLYRNAYFGFSYFIPEQWSARPVGGKLPGLADGYVLLPLKRQSGDPLSSITVSAVDLSKYGGDLMQFLDERYRLRRETAEESETLINGIRVSRSKPREQEPEPEALIIGQRTFYRLSEESTGVTRLTVATTEKGYALIFELVTPERLADSLRTPFMDSLHGLDFGPTKAAAGN